MEINFSFVLILFFLLTLIPLLGHLVPATFNEDDADVIPEIGISPCLLLLSFSLGWFGVGFGAGGGCLVVWFFSFSCKHRLQTFWYGS